MHHVLRRTFGCWSAGTPVEIIEKVDGENSALVRINRTTATDVGKDATTGKRRHYVTRRSEQIVIPMEYLTERKRG